MKAIVFESYASGTVPASHEDFNKIFKKFFQEKIGIKVSQATQGTIESDYVNNICFPNLFDGFDINDISAYFKLSYLFAKFKDKEKIKSMINLDIRGEKSEQNMVNKDFFNPVNYYFKSLKINNNILKKEFVDSFMMKNIIKAAFAQNDFKTISYLLEQNLVNL